MNLTTNQATQATQAPVVQPITIPDGLKSETFNFRPRPVKNADGSTQKGPDGKDVTTKRDPITLGLPYITGAELETILTDENTNVAVLLPYLAELVNDAIYEATQAKINEFLATAQEPTQDNIGVESLRLMALAAAPKKESNRGIAKEVWAAFKIDFINILTSKFGVSADGATYSARLIADDRLTSVRTNPVYLNHMQKYLANWFSSTTPEAQITYAPIYEDMTTKITTYLNVSPEDALAKIM